MMLIIIDLVIFSANLRLSRFFRVEIVKLTIHSAQHHGRLPFNLIFLEKYLSRTYIAGKCSLKNNFDCDFYYSVFESRDNSTFIIEIIR